MNLFRRRAEGEQGQVIAVFAICLVAIVAMTGLVLDGGSTFVQRRDMQNVADSASMAGAYNYANNKDTAQAIAAAKAMAAANGFTDGADGVVVTVNVGPGPTGGTTVQVWVTKPHRNMFSGIVGMSQWDVSTTARTLTGRPNAVRGAMPIIFNQTAFTGNGTGPDHEQSYDEIKTGSNDIPKTSTEFNWTVYCNNCNADSNTVDGLIKQHGSISVVSLNDKISPLNAGSHATLFSSLSNLVGKEFPVPIVDDAGKMVGWAMFHLTGSVGGSTKQIRGYFVSPINPANMEIVASGGDATGDFGSYIVQLVH